MLSLFFNGGVFMWLLLIIAISIIILSIKKAIDLFGSKISDPNHLEKGINAIIFWGGVSLVVGFLAHFWGLQLAMMAISHANDISPTIVANGFAVSLITIIFGMLIFLFSAIIWFIFRWQYKKLTA